MATGTEILSYQGNPLAGLGANPGIPVSTTKDLDVVNQAGANATLLNAQRNMEIFKQRIDDRDATLKALADGKVTTGNMLERDRPLLLSALDKQTEAFKKWGGNPNDINGALAYKQATQDAQDIVTKAQDRWVNDTKERALIAGETSDQKRQAIQDNLDSYYKKGFFADFVPHQQLLDFNHNELNQSTLRDALVPNAGIMEPSGQTIHKTVTKMVNGKLTTVDVQTNQPVKAGATTKGGSISPTGGLSLFSTVPGKYYDYDKILNNATDDFVHDEKVRGYQNMWRSYIEQANPLEAKKIIDYTNDKIKQYNTERGITGTPKEVKQITDSDAFLDPTTGKFQINMPTSEFAAKTALASINGGYVQKDEQQFNKDEASALQNQQDLSEKARHDKAMEAIDWGKLGVEKEKLKDATKDDQYGAGVVLDTLSSIINKGEKASPVSFGGINPIFKISDPTLLQTFGKVDKNGIHYDIPNEVQYDKSNGQLNLIYYKTDSDGTLDLTDGKPTVDDAKTKSLDERTWVSETTKQLFPNKDIGKINSLVDDALNSNGNSLYKLSQKYSGNTPTNADEKTGLSLDATDWKQEGNNWRYKDGTLYDSKGKVIKKK